MKLSFPILWVTTLLFVAVGSEVFSQNQPNVAPGIGRPILVNNDPQAATHQPLLSSNYLVTLAATSEGKSMGELSLLTCSTELKVSGPLSAEVAPITLYLTGSLTEMDGELHLQYELDMTIPVKGVSPATKEGKQNSSLEYNGQQAGGRLRMKAGRPYEVLKQAGITYIMTVSEAREK
jgi:hypothetical protein